MFNSLKTPFENNSELSWDEYPRPQFKRESFYSLNGEWELFAKGKNITDSIGKITVPFPPESRISGVFRQIKSGEKYIYRRVFTLPEGFVKDKVLLHFGAVDQIAHIFINGIFAHSNTGGYLPFTVDITDFLKDGENEISVEVTDNLDTDIPYGKQSKKRGGMWYTPTSGIWQTVWLESVPKNYIKGLKITPSLHGVTVEVEGADAEKQITVVTQNGNEVHTFKGKSTVIEIQNPINWSPENPYLYSFTLTSGEDKIESYFALRTVSVEERNGRSYICLNGKPYFFHGLLDQGYFADGIYTPATPEGYIRDIESMKNLGFNMLRKHIKIEPDLFYYYCDKLGMIVFQDMVNSGKYNFLIDTALPTVGIKRGISHKACKRRKELFEKSCSQTIEHLHNHPCVCYYTVFNEGWGQYDADRIYTQLKGYDHTRIFDSTSGWFFENKSDVESQHIYFRKLKFKKRYNQPLVLSEFGGYSCRLEEHSFNPKSSFGYSKNLTQKQFENALLSLYTEQVIPAIERNGLCATVLTQLSDVEDETNGIITFDRRVIKVEKEPMNNMAKRLFNTFENTVK